MRRLATLLAALGLTLAAGAAGAPAALAQETTPPVTTASLDPADPGPGGTYDAPVDVTLSATDPDEGGPDPQTYEVTAEGFTWDPSRVESTAGDTVEWDFSGGGTTSASTTARPRGAEDFGDCGDDEVLGDFREGDTGGSKTFTAPGTRSASTAASTSRRCAAPSTSPRAAGSPAPASTSREYRVITDGATGEWQSENTAPRTRSRPRSRCRAEGEHVVEYCSTDDDGNVRKRPQVEF